MSRTSNPEIFRVMRQQDPLQAELLMAGILKTFPYYPCVILLCGIVPNKVQPNLKQLEV